MQAATPDSGAPPAPPAAIASALRHAVDEIAEKYGPELRDVLMAAVGRLIDYQDADYAKEFLARLQPFDLLEASHGDRSGRLLAEVARQLALGMTYEDTIRVAELKNSAQPFRAGARGSASRSRPDSRNC